MVRAVLFQLAVASVLLAACDTAPVGGAVATVAASQPASTMQPTALPSRPAPASISRETRRCEVWLDASLSVEPNTRRAVVGRLVSHIATIAEVENFDTCEFYEFAKMPWRAEPFYAFRLPRYVEPTLQEPTCESPKQTEMRRLFKDRWNQEQQRVQLACARLWSDARARHQEEQNAARENHEKKMEYVLAELMRMLIDRQPFAKEECTNITDHLARIAQSRGPLTVLSIGDGVEDCRASLGPIGAPSGDIHLLMVLADTKLPQADTLAQDFDRRRRELAAAAPWVRGIVPFWMLDSNVFEKNAAPVSVSVGQPN